MDNRFARRSAGAGDFGEGNRMDNNEHSTNLAEVDTDCISRQAAIDAIHCDITITGRQNAELVAATIGAFADRIKALPSAQPKRGLWIDDGSELGCQCSQCGKTLDEYINCGTEYMTLTEIPKFCPNCGADMRGEQDDKQRSD